MYVKDHMTVAPTTITSDVTVSKALDMMAHGNFHRLPVVDKNGKLVGLITSGMVSEGTGANKTSLSIYELNYLLSKTQVKEVMTYKVVTISPDVFVEEAADVMLINHISVLPVVDAENHVIGIITEKDIFRAFVELLGYKHQGTKFVIPCEDKPGEFLKIAKLFADNDANLQNLGVYHSERGAEIVIKATGAIPVETMMKILVEAGFTLIDVIQTTAEGEVIHFPV